MLSNAMKNPHSPNLSRGGVRGFQLISVLRLEAGPQPFEAAEVLHSRSSKGRHNKKKNRQLRHHKFSKIYAKEGNGH